MKRSEMVEALREWIMRCNYGSEFVDHASGMIKFLERQGMQPPAIPKKYVFDDSGEGAVVMFNEWEPEIAQETVDQALEHIGKKGVIGEMEITL